MKRLGKALPLSLRSQSVRSNSASGWTTEVSRMKTWPFDLTAEKKVSQRLGRSWFPLNHTMHDFRSTQETDTQIMHISIKHTFIPKPQKREILYSCFYLVWSKIGKSARCYSATAFIFIIILNLFQLLIKFYVILSFYSYFCNGFIFYSRSIDLNIITLKWEMLPSQLTSWNKKICIYV